MNWLEEMQRTAAELAFPDHVWTDGEAGRVSTDWDPGYSAETPGDGFSFVVEIVLDGEVTMRHCSYSGRDADEFFTALMEAGSAS